PDAAFAIAHRFVGRVMEEGIDRLAVIGPLLGAIVTADHAPVAHGLGIGRRQDRRARAGATIIAGRTAGWIEIVGVKPLVAGEAAVDIAVLFLRQSDLGRIRQVGVKG